MRYARHISLNEVGQAGQEKLFAAKVLVVGAGGLGCPALQYLVAAGVGTIGIVDGDRVSESNLQRQILYTTHDIGRKKVEVAKERLTSLNPDVEIRVYPENITRKNALEIIEPYELVIDGTDNFGTRYLINDACVKMNKPFVYGAIHKFEGQVSVFNYSGGPTYRCLFPEAPSQNQIPNCAEVGVLGVLPGVIGTLQATEAIKTILEIGNPLSGKLKVLNLLNNSEELISFSRNEEQLTKAMNMNFEDSHQDSVCSSPIHITAKQLLNWVNIEAKPITILDVREPHEMPKWNASEVLNIPLGQIPSRANEIPISQPLVVICQHGIRSQQAIEFLAQNNFPNQLINLEGGMSAVYQESIVK